MRPVRIEGRTIARTFWGKAWCDNLEAYSDFENRLPRGRTYVRNGSVIDLKIEPGKVRALVVGSSLYKIEIGITAVPDARWKSLARECTGSIASLVELLQGKLLECRDGAHLSAEDGAVSRAADIRLDCSCPDWATMCKHVAAVLYGVGARLDAQPELLFTLRQVDASDLVTRATQLTVKTRKKPARGKVLDDSRLADVFGIEMDAPEVLPDANRKTGARRTKPATVVPKKPTRASAKTKVVAAKRPITPAQTKRKKPQT